MLRELRHEELSPLILLLLELEVVLEVLANFKLQLLAQPALFNMLVDNLELTPVGHLFLLERLEDIADVGDGVAENTTNYKSHKDDEHPFVVSDRHQVPVPDREGCDSAPVKRVDVLCEKAGFDNALSGEPAMANSELLQLRFADVMPSTRAEVANKYNKIDELE